MQVQHCPLSPPSKRVLAHRAGRTATEARARLRQVVLAINEELKAMGSAGGRVSVGGSLSVDRWAAHHVSEWLCTEVGMPQYAATFGTRGVDGPLLLELDHDLLRTGPSFTPRS